MTIETPLQVLNNPMSFHFSNDQKIEQIISNSPMVFITADKNGYINYIAGELLSPFGIDKDGCIGTSIFYEHSILASLSSYSHLALDGISNNSHIVIEDRQFHFWFSPLSNNQQIIGLSIICMEGFEDNFQAQISREDLEHYELLVNYSTDVIIKFDCEGVCSFASPSVKNIMGYEPEELLNNSIFDYFHPDDAKSKRRLYNKLAEHASSETISFRIRHKNDHYIWLETENTSFTHPETGEITEIISVSRDITERKETEERLLYLANFDSLTGLPNRALFRDRLRRAVARAQRNSTKLALFFIDLDRFKTINDSLGHHAGDQLLRSVAKRLKQFARQQDTIARLGGDEFTVILEGIEDTDDVAMVAEKILELMAPPFRLDGHMLVVTPSIGITIFPDDSDNMRALLKNADTAMYRSKENGGNCFEFYTSDMNDKAYQTLVLENSLRSALEKEQFRLFYQPQIDLHSQSIIGIEALLRWDHPEQGLLNPEEFIPFTEETGLIEPIGEWILREACKEAKRWQELGLPHIRVAVNLSMRQFVARNFVDYVSHALQEANLSPQFLELEITESFLAQNVEQATEILHGLHDLGVQLSIDDFGTGYSSLAYLRQFPLNTLKIDRSFVQGITNNPESATIVEAIIALAQSLKLNVIAEGVENEEQVFFLRGHGCDWVQGYLIGEPVPSDKIVRWIKRNNKVSMQYEQTLLWPSLANASH